MAEGRQGPIGLVCVCVALGAAQAQAGDWTLVPYFTTSAVFDDNIFAVSEPRVKDWSASFSPAIIANYKSRKLTFAGRYSVAGQVFPNEPELNEPLARQNASLTVSYPIAYKTTLSAYAGFASSFYSSEVFPVAAFDQGRNLTKSLTAGLSAGRSWRRDTLGLSYSFNRVDSGGLGIGQSHLVSLSWHHKLWKHTSFFVSGGPRYREETQNTTATFAVGLAQELGHGQLSLSYSRGYELVPGFDSTGDLQSKNVSLSYGLISKRSWRVNVLAGYYQGVGATSPTVTTYRAGATSTYRLFSWLYADGAYRYSWQDVDQGDRFARNVYTIGLTITPPRKDFLHL